MFPKKPSDLSISSPLPQKASESPFVQETDILFVKNDVYDVSLNILLCSQMFGKYLLTIRPLLYQEVPVLLLLPRKSIVKMDVGLQALLPLLTKPISPFPFQVM